MSTPHAKRRRLNEASKTLHKPFKSPFRNPIKPTNPNTPVSNTSSLDAVTNADTPSQAPIVSDVSTPTVSTPGPDPVLTPTPSRILALPMHSNKLKAKPTPQSRTKANPALTRAAISLRSDIQILSQAHALATSDKDEKLLALIETWRTASRAVAEEVFSSTRERVQRMGGVGAWREREREQKAWRNKWDEEDRKAEHEGKAGDVVEQEERDEEDEDQDEVKGNDDDSFTMDMMLRTLNIDVKLIGYDPNSQRWVG